MSNNINIKSNEFYTANSVVVMGILPWKSRFTFAKVLKTNPKYQKVFNPVIENGRIHIKGEDILKYLKMQKEGKLR